MSLEPNTITPLQSNTIRAAAALIIVQMVRIFFAWKGQDFDASDVTAQVDHFMTMYAPLIDLALGWLIIHFRMRATEKIVTKPTGESK